MCPIALRGVLRDGTVGVVCGHVTNQNAGVRGPGIRNWEAAVRGDHIDVEVHQSLSGDGPAARAHAVGGMANRTSETSINVVAVLVPACIRDDIIEVMTLATHRIGALDAQIRVGIQVGNQLSGRGRLVKLVVALEDVLKRGSVRPAGTHSAKFPVIVTVMAITAEGLGSHRTPVRCAAAQIQHRRQQAGLRQLTAASMSDWMTGSSGSGELWNDVQWITR